jgi:hypothetical protein
MLSHTGYVSRSVDSVPKKHYIGIKSVRIAGWSRNIR